MVVQGTVVQEDPTTRKTLRDEYWDKTEEVLGQSSLGIVVLGQGLGTVVLGQGLGTGVLGQWSWDRVLGQWSWDSLGTVVLGH